jgi:DNA repair protein RadC
MTIQQWPEHDRPRERLLQHGAGQLSDSELLAILIQSGTAKQSSVDCARALLSNFNNLRGVIDANKKDIFNQPGLGPAKYALIQASAELGRRYLKQNQRFRGAILSADQAKHYFKLTLSHKKVECVGFLYLNAAHEIITYEEPFQGSVTKVHVHYRECIKKALSLDAAAIIMAHNHPSGLAKASQADIQSTEQLTQALKLVDISLLDHIIVGMNSELSMRNEGLMDPQQRFVK